MLRDDEDVAELLTNARTIAMVGASDRPDRPSNGVMKFLQGRGYKVFPVNPTITGELGLGGFPDCGDSEPHDLDLRAAVHHDF